MRQCIWLNSEQPAFIVSGRHDSYLDFARGNADAWPHASRHKDSLHVGGFYACWLCGFEARNNNCSVFAKFSGTETDLTDGKVDDTVESTRNSTRPALASLTAFATSFVTVPLLGFGIRPFGPSVRAYLPSLAII